jgi:hypothetical protein
MPLRPGRALAVPGAEFAARVVGQPQACGLLGSWLAGETSVSDKLGFVWGDDTMADRPRQNQVGVTGRRPDPLCGEAGVAEAATPGYQLCTFERVRGGLETPTVNINDDGLLPLQARAFASALIASAQMADMSGATFGHGQAVQQYRD